MTKTTATPSIPRVIFGFITFFMITLTLGTYLSKQYSTPQPKAARSGAEKAEAYFYTSVGNEQDEAIAEKDTSPGIEGYTLEIKSTADRVEAERIVDRLAEKGIEAFYTPLAADGHIVYRIRRGIYPNQTEAEAAAGLLAKQHHVSAKVTRLQ